MSLNLNNYKRISGLTAKANLDANDAFAVDNSSDASTQKVSYSTLQSLLKTYFKLGNLTSGHYIEGNSYAADLGILDTQLYTQRGLIDTVLADIAPVQTSTTATQAFAVGSYLIYSNKLYIVTAAIASGGTIVVGTNVAEVTVGSALITTAMMLASAYSTSTSYAAGDVVTHAGNLYVCTSSTTGTWDSTKWSNVTVAALLDDLAGDIGALSSLSTTAKTSIVAAINEVDSHADTNAESIGTVAGSITDLYSSNATYKVGDLCIHNNRLYKCTTAINVGESWNSAHWTMTTIADELELIGFHHLIVVTLPGITSLPKTFNVSGITSDHEFIQDGSAIVTPSSSVGSDWTFTPGNGTIQITGTFSGSTSTTVKVTMGIPNNKVTGVAQ